MNNNETIAAFLCGLGTGAALMYFLDPNRGRRRRALVRDKAVALSNDASEAISGTAEDLSNTAYGIMAETNKAITGKPIDENRSTEI